jgi:hypothetical protein
MKNTNTAVNNAALLRYYNDPLTKLGFISKDFSLYFSPFKLA